MAQLAKAFHRPHVHDGNYSTFRHRRFGAPADDVPPERFVVFSQNHDQVGNRAFGDRMPPEVRPLAAFCTLLSPFVPAAVHGRGVRRDGAVPVLLRSHRRGDRPGHARRAPARVRRLRLVRRGDPRPSGRGHVRALASSPAEGDPQLAELYRRLLALRRRLPRGEADPIEFDEEARWLRVGRGAFELLCNFGSEALLLPVAVGAHVELATDPATELIGPSSGVGRSPGAGTAPHLRLAPLSGALVG